MSGSSLRGTNLSGAQLAGANLSACDLEGACLTGADLRGAGLEGANLEGANLYGADIMSVTGKPLRKTADPIGFCKALAEELMGQGAIVTSARRGAAYRGEIISATDNGLEILALTAISDTHAILHEIRKTDMVISDLEIGAEVVLAVDGQGYSSVQGGDAETLSNAREGHGR
jgi:uncharacterized protein YjbI with pentapeptide repeats